MALNNDNDVKAAFQFLVTKASKEAVKRGLIKQELPQQVASGIADQLFFTVDLCKKGVNISPRQLGILLAQKGFGVLKISSQGRWDCGIAIGTVIFSLAKFSAGGPCSMMIQGASLLYDCYRMDHSCGISDAAEAEVRRKAAEVSMFLDSGIREWLSRGH